MFQFIAVHITELDFFDNLLLQARSTLDWLNSAILAGRQLLHNMLSLIGQKPIQLLYGALQQWLCQEMRSACTNSKSNKYWQKQLAVTFEH